MALANVNLKFGINLRDFDSKLEKVNKSLQKTGAKMTSLGKSLSIGLSLPIIAIGAASVKAASDAEETFSKFDTVFRDVKGSAEESFKVLREQYGLSSRASKQLLSDTGDLLTGFGFSQGAALGLSTEVQKLAVDLASFTNYSGGAEGASQALTKALLGERESLKALGIAISEEDVKKQMAINATKGLIFETERQAKAQATLDLAIQQSGNAIGDYARTQDGFANQMRLMRARFEDISVEIGQVFLPVLTKIVGAVTGVVNWFSNLDAGVKKTIVIVGAIVAAIGPLLVGLGFLMTTILPALKVGFTVLTAVMSPLTLKILAVTAVVGGLILITKGIIDSWDTIKAYFSTLWDKIKLFFIKGVANTLEVFNKFTSAIGLDFSETVNSLKADAAEMQTALDAQPIITLGDVFSDIGSSIMNTFTSTKDAIVGAMGTSKDAIDEVVVAAGNLGGIGGAKKQDRSGVGPAIDGPSVANPFGDLSIQLPEQMKGITDQLAAVSPIINQEAQMLTDSFNSIINDGIMNGLGAFGAGIGELIAGTASIGDVGNMLLGVLGGVLGQLGQLAIASGVAVEAIKTALKSLGGVGAIAAGVALIALSKVVSSRAGKIAGGGGGGGPLGAPSSIQGARAMGGTVQYNKPYLVGERGPEIFTPSGYGSITPNHQMGMGNEITVHVTGRLVGEGRNLVGIIDDYQKIKGRTT